MARRILLPVDEVLMIKILLSLTLLATGGIACNGANISSSVDKGKAKPGSSVGGGGDIVSGDAQASPSTGDQTSGTTPPPAESEEVVLTPALQPTVIAGAFLTCKPLTDSAECETRTSLNGPLKDFENGKFYIIEPEKLTWTETAAKKISVGTYSIATKLASFAIGFQLGDGGITGTWVKPPPQNLARDGSFETYKPSSTVVSQEFDAWYSILESNNDCAASYIEVQSATKELAARDGAQYLDLNAPCYPGTKDYSDHTVSQDVATVKAHLYEVLFSFSPNPIRAQNNIIAAWDGLDMFSINLPVTAPLQWTDLRYTVSATKDKSSFGFRDMYGNKDGNGTLLDNVRLYDLGAGPVAAK